MDKGKANTTAEGLTASYLAAAGAEEAAWRELGISREQLVDRASGAAIAPLRKAMEVVEGKSRLDLGDAKAAAALATLTAVAGAEATGVWLHAARAFHDASDRAFRAASELSDLGGPALRQFAEGFAEMGELRRELLARAARINPTVDIRFMREMFGEGPALVASGAASGDRMPVAGMYEPYYHLATVSLDRRFDAVDTTYHETWHSIESVLTGKELAVLRKAFPAAGGMSSDERIATAFAAWARKREGAGREAELARLDVGSDSGGVRRAFRKAGLLLGRTGQSLLGKGYENAEQVFEKAFGGEMGRRMVEYMRRHRGARAAARRSGMDMPLASAGVAFTLGGDGVSQEPRAVLAMYRAGLRHAGVDSDFPPVRLCPPHTLRIIGDPGAEQRYVGEASVEGGAVVIRAYARPVRGNERGEVVAGDIALCHPQLARAAEVAERLQLASAPPVFASQGVAPERAADAPASSAGPVPLRVDPARPAEAIRALRQVDREALPALRRATEEALASSEGSRDRGELAVGLRMITAEMTRVGLLQPAPGRPAPGRAGLER